MASGLAPYQSVAAAKLRSVAESPRLFALRCVGDAMMVSLEALVPFILVGRFGSVAGWSASEVAMLLGLGRTAEAIAYGFGRGVDPAHFGETVRLGRFDQVLTRPVSPLGWLLASEVEPRYVFRGLAGVAVLTVGAGLADVPATPANLTLLAGACAACAVVVLSIIVMGGALTFVTTEGSDIANLFSAGGLSLSSLPLELYGSVLRTVFTFLIPIGLCVYVPVIVVLGRDGPGPLGPALLWALPVVVALFVAVAAAAWRGGVRHYRSTGS